MSLLVQRFSGNLMGSLDVLRRKALRTGIWFQTLSLQDRILANLVQRHVKIVKNTTLATVIARIMIKLISAIKGSVPDRLEMAGRPIAEAVASKAYSFGNKAAARWPADLNYVRYMGLTHSPVLVAAPASTRGGLAVARRAA